MPGSGAYDECMDIEATSGCAQTWIKRIGCEYGRNRWIFGSAMVFWDHSKTEQVKKNGDM